MKINHLRIILCMLCACILVLISFFITKNNFNIDKELHLDFHYYLDGYSYYIYTETGFFYNGNIPMEGLPHATMQATGWGAHVILNDYGKFIVVVLFSESKKYSILIAEEEITEERLVISLIDDDLVYKATNKLLGHEVFLPAWLRNL